MSAIDTLLSRIPGAKSIGGSRWKACCPAHKEKTPSLYITGTDDGRVLIHCFGGCDALSVVSAVGLEMSALFPERLPDGLPRRRMGLSAVDVLRVMRHELQALQIIADAFADGVATKEHTDRAKRLSQRILTALDVVDGHR